MRRFSAILLVFALLLTIIPVTATCEGAPPRIVATIFPPFDFARTITGGEAELTMLLSPGAEAHTYEPTPSDILEIQNCDLFLMIGGESEAWADRILAGLDTSSMTIVRLMGSVTPMMDEDGDDFDEHIWTAMPNAVAMLEAVADALCEIRPSSAEFYHQNATGALHELAALDEAFRDLAENSARRLIVIGDRCPFRYFEQKYGIETFAALSGCGAEMEPSAVTIFELIQLILERHIPVIFTIEFSNGRIARTLSEETGAEILTLHSGHNLSKDDLDAGLTFPGVMRQNLENLRVALN